MTMKMYSDEERRSFTEVYDIIMCLDEECKSKIPLKLIKFLEKARDKEYITTINPYIPIQLQKISKQSSLFISYIYMKYLKNIKNNL